MADNNRKDANKLHKEDRGKLYGKIQLEMGFAANEYSQFWICWVIPPDISLPWMTLAFHPIFVPVYTEPKAPKSAMMD